MKENDETEKAVCLMRNILFYANTFYQLMVAINLCETTIEADSKIDIVLTDHTNGMEAVAIRLREENIFRNVYFIQIKSYDQGKQFLFDENSIREKFFGTAIQVEKIIHLNEVYDEFWFAYPTNFIKLLYSYTCIKRGRTVDAFCFEDGLSVYCEAPKWFHEKLTWKNKLIRILQKQTELRKGLKGIYMFMPELREWSMHVPIYQIPKIKREELYRYRRIFENGFDQQINNYRFIYLEQNFRAIGNQDVDVLEKIAGIIGKENIYVKLHPRTEQDRFAKNGFFTNKDNYFPSEMLLLCEKLEDKYFLSIFSSSLVVPYIAFGVRTVSISLLGLFDENLHRTLEQMKVLFERLVELEPDVFYMPRSMEELKIILKSEITEKERNVVQ
jgi:hypothetical protein